MVQPFGGSIPEAAMAPLGAGRPTRDTPGSVAPRKRAESLTRCDFSASPPAAAS